jgi:hypothetical protein
MEKLFKKRENSFINWSKTGLPLRLLGWKRRWLCLLLASTG